MDPKSGDEEERQPLKEDEKGEGASIRNMDDVFQLVGNFGRWQIITTLVLGWITVVSGMGNMVIVFMQLQPDFFCAGPHNTKNEEEPNPAHLLNASLINTCGEKCDHFLYDSSEMQRTIVTDWDLVCGREWEAATAQMIHMLGILTGSALVGPAADKLGRRRVLFGFILLQCVFTAGQGLSPYYPLFLLCRYLSALFMTGSWMTPFSYLGEMTTGPPRTAVTGLFFVPYAIGYALLSPMAYFLKDWRLMLVTIAGLLVPVLPFFFWFLESPRWLLAVGQVDAAAELLETKVAGRNGRKLPPSLNLHAVLTRIAKEEGGGEVREESMLTLLKYPRLIFRCAILILIWFANNIVYYGVSLNITSFSGDVFLNNAIFALVEIPSYGLGTLMLRAGRKPTQMILLAATGALLLAVAWMEGTGSLVLAILGKVTITASFAVIYVFTAELYPTLIRNSGLGLSSMASRVGGMVAPYIAIIATVDPSLDYVPMLLYSVLSFAAALLVLFLPETQGRPLPDTIHDAAKHRPSESSGDENIGCFQRQWQKVFHTPARSAAPPPTSAD